MGLPVVPEVYSRVTGSSGPTAAIRAADGAGIGSEPLLAQRGEGVPGQVLVPGRAGGRVPDDDLLHAGQAVEDLLPAGELGGAVQHRDPGVAVPRDVGDLVRRQGGVEGDRGPARVHGGQVGEHVLGAVGEHERHPLALGQAQGGEARPPAPAPAAGSAPRSGSASRCRPRPGRTGRARRPSSPRSPAGGRRSSGLRYPARSRPAAGVSRSSRCPSPVTARIRLAGHPVGRAVPVLHECHHVAVRAATIRHSA